MTKSTGVITTIAGSGGTSGGFSGDGSAATSATLNYPQVIDFDSSGTPSVILYCSSWLIREL